MAATSSGRLTMAATGRPSLRARVLRERSSIASGRDGQPTEVLTNDRASRRSDGPEAARTRSAEGCNTSAETALGSGFTAGRDANLAMILEYLRDLSNRVE